MAFIIVETYSEQPLTPEEPSAADFRTLACIEERNGTWKYSLLSGDRRQMICVFEAPDTESIRESYQRGGVAFSRMWSGTIEMPEHQLSQQDANKLRVLICDYPNGLTQSARETAALKALPCLVERGAEWIRSYLSSDRTRTICEFNAPDAEVIRETKRRLGQPFDRVLSVKVISPETMIAHNN